MRGTYWYTLFYVSDPVVEIFGNIWDLRVRPFCVESSRVFLMVLGVIVWSILLSGYSERRNMF